MATTKQLLEAALLKIGSRASAPSPTVDTINVVLDDNGKKATYTPPADGYLYLEHRGVAPNSDYVDVSQNARWYNSRTYDPANDYPISFTTYVTKGVELTIRYVGHTTCRLIKSVGGGGVAFLRKLLSVGGRYAYA